MRLTRKKAIELCIELWTWLAKTGKPKEFWPEWKKYGDIDILCDCWLCEYGHQRIMRLNATFADKCDYCPYCKKYNRCYNYTPKVTLYEHWRNAETPRTRKKYAKLFLEQIKSLRSKK